MTLNTRIARAAQEPSRSSSDPIPTWLATIRKCATLSVVVRLARSGPNNLDELDAEIRRLVVAALAAPSLHRKVLNLWKIEGLVFRFFESRNDPALSLRRSSMPLEAGPPAHCGLAMAVVLQEGFDPERLLERFSIAADPRFVRFCHETTGLMLAIAESGLFGGLTRSAAALGLLRSRLAEPPEADGFLPTWSVEQRRLAAHGFGRAMYFATVGFGRAVSRVVRANERPTAAALRGLNSANSLINSRDLDLLLARGSDGYSTKVIEGLDGGLYNTLCLLEWTIPGCLGGLNRTNDRSMRIIDAAVAAARSARDNDLGPPMES